MAVRGRIALKEYLIVLTSDRILIVATLFLKRENNEKLPLVIKCDKRDLEKLSLLIVAEEEKSIQTAVTPSPSSAIPTDELIKLKELMDAGIVTQEEFDAKKKQLLGI